MKQLTKLGMLFAGLGLLASCSNDNINDPTPNSPNVDMSGKTEGNISFNICTFPNEGTKTGEEYNEGSKEIENKVNSGYVFIFGGNVTNESDATFIESAELEFSDWAYSNDSYLEKVGIAKGKAKLTGNYVTTNKYWAVMVLNATNYDAYNFTSSSKLTDFLAVTTNTLGSTTTSTETAGFLMSSAPSYQDNSSVTWMAPISDDWVKNRTADYTAANVYVQRVAAKVTVDTNNTTIESGENLDNITVVGWDLDNTNTSSFLLQNVDLGWEDKAHESRFFAYTPGNDVQHNRIFWSKDRNYDNQYDATSNPDIPQLQNLYNTTNDWGTASFTTADKYCHENTFPINYMTKDNSTRVLLAATCVPNGLQKTNNGAYDGELENVPSNTPVSFLKNVDGTVWTKSSLEKAIATVLTTYTTPEPGQEPQEIVPRVSLTLPERGDTSLNLSALNVQVNGGNIGGEDLDKVRASLRILGNNLDFYKDGYCYYQMIIRHFTNGETGVDDDWKIGSSAITEYTGNEEYTDGVDAFLGRYGVVRNNWYVLTVSSISKIGEPTPPKPDKKTDDDPDEQWIKFTVNILSWAMRRHTYEL